MSTLQLSPLNKEKLNSDLKIFSPTSKQPSKFFHYRVENFSINNEPRSYKIDENKSLTQTISRFHFNASFLQKSRNFQEDCTKAQTEDKINREYQDGAIKLRHNNHLVKILLGDQDLRRRTMNDKKIKLETMEPVRMPVIVP